VGYLKILLVDLVFYFISMKIDRLIFLDVLYWLYAFTIYGSLFLCINLKLRIIISWLNICVVSFDCYVFLNYLHVVFLVVFRKKDSEVTRAYVDPLVVHVQRI